MTDHPEGPRCGRCGREVRVDLASCPNCAPYTPAENPDGLALTTHCKCNDTGKPWTACRSTRVEAASDARRRWRGMAVA